MTIVGLIILLVVIGGALYLLNYAPIDETIKGVIRIVCVVLVIIVVILFFAGLLGLSTGLQGVRIR